MAGTSTNRSENSPTTTNRAVAPVVGIACLLVIVVALAAVVATGALAMSDTSGMQTTIDRTLSQGTADSTPNTPTCTVTKTDGDAVIRDPRPHRVAADTVTVDCSGVESGRVTVGDAEAALTDGEATITRADAPTEGLDADGQSVAVVVDGETVYSATV